MDDARWRVRLCVNTTREQAKHQRRRAIVTAWVLAALAVSFFLLTVFRLGGNVMNRAL